MSFEEFPVYLAAGQEHLSGVVCVPVGEVGTPGVVLLTGGNYTRTHRNRMWVRAARALAERGFASIRIDYHGVGDSTGRATIDLERPFVEDAIAAAAFLRRATGLDRMVMAATCFGGRTAVAATVRDPSIVCAILFPVPVVLPTRRGRQPQGRRIRRRLKELRPIRSVLRQPQIHRLRRAKARRARPASFATSPTFRRELREALGRIEVRFVYGERTASLAEFHQLVAELGPELGPARRPRLRLEVVPDAEVAGFQTLADQDLAIEKVIETVTEVSGTTQVPPPADLSR